MKLGKTLIVTGILFSSILGSVNVGSITAMATDQQGTQSNNQPSTGNANVDDKKVTIHFIVNGSNAPENKDIYVGKDKNEVTLTKENIPDGYKVVDKSNTFKIDEKNTINVNLEKILTEPSKPVTKPSKPARYVVQRVRITFVDQNSKALVGFKQVTGKDSFSTKIEAPKGYAFVNDKDATIKFDKKGNKDINVAVKLMTAAPIKQEGTLTTNGGSYKRLYTLEGKLITNRALGANSKWYTDQYATVNGSKMYRVATNEWVKASDVH